MTVFGREQTEYDLFLGMMESLDQAFLARQGQGLADDLPERAGQKTEAWGVRFFQALDELYPSWPERDVYLMAGQLLYRFAHTRTEPVTCASLWQKPESLLRLAVMLLKHNSTDSFFC